MEDAALDVSESDLEWFCKNMYEVRATCFAYVIITDEQEHNMC